MLQNQNPVRRWKQWLVLPVLGGLFFVAGHAASAQTEPTGRAQITPMLSEAQLNERKEIINRKVREAEHEDSLRTGGKVEPGMAKQFHIMNMDKLEDIKVTITRVPIRRLAEPQPGTSSGDKVYTFVEEMPHLPGGGGQAAIVKAIRQNVVYPKSMTKGNTVQGRVFAQFLVTAKGEVQETKIVKGLNPALDNAVLAAISELPRFEPGKQNGQPVAVIFTVPIAFQ